MKYRKTSWRTRASLTPGQSGTAKETHKYGDQLICVRYRYDVNSNRRIKTVEIVVDEKVIAPPIKNLGIKPKQYPCREFVAHDKAIHTCSTCGWPRQDHKAKKLE